MSHADIELRLREWFEQILQMAQPEDPRRTAECLSFAEVASLAEEAVRQNTNPCDVLPVEKAEHVAECSWCTSALDKAWCLAQVRPQEPEAGEAGWAATLRQRLSDWVHRRAQESSSAAVGHFDEEGTFHLNLYGLPKDGPVQVSLLWEGVRVRLGQGVVSSGRLQLSERLGRIGLRNASLPAHLLVIEPLQESDQARDGTIPE